MSDPRFKIGQRVRVLATPWDQDPGLGSVPMDMIGKTGVVIGYGYEYYNYTVRLDDGSESEVGVYVSEIVPEGVLPMTQYPDV